MKSTLSAVVVILTITTFTCIARSQTTLEVSSVVRPGALDDIPRHLTEVGWDTDLPSLLSIRFMPELMNLEPGWSSWVTGEMLKQQGGLRQPAVQPWPAFFKNDRKLFFAGNLSTSDMQAFQAWCLRRSQVIPQVIVHAVPYVVPMATPDTNEVRILPLGLAPGQPKESQRVRGVGFSQVIYMGLTQDADEYAADVSREVIAALPSVGVSLETRLRWSDPVRVDGTLLFNGEPQSIRLVADRRIIWEHRYAAPAAPGQSPTPQASRPAPPAQSDIKF